MISFPQQQLIFYKKNNNISTITQQYQYLAHQIRNPLRKSSEYRYFGQTFGQTSPDRHCGENVLSGELYGRIAAEIIGRNMVEM